MDYLDRAALVEHKDWATFEIWRQENGHRLIVLTTKAATAYTEFAFRPGDVLLLGRESAGLPDEVHGVADAKLTIPQAEGTRSLNVAIAGGMAVGEALRQLDGFPGAKAG
jgi:tRNA (cytidine/uridine-2'-O-)-methyltransferase